MFSHFSLRRDLGVQLLALYLLFVTPVVLGALTFDHFAARRLDEDVRAADLALAQAIAQETNTVLDNALQAVRQLAAYPSVVQADPTGMEAIFQVVMSARSDINLIYRLDADGVMLYHYPPGPGSTVGVDFSFREYFQRAQRTHSPLISKGRISPTTQQAVATAVMPLWSPQGEFLGLVGTNIKLQSLSHTLTRILESRQTDADLQVFILDSDGKVIAHPDPVMLLTDARDTLPEVVTRVLTGHMGNQIGQDFADTETLYSYVPVPSVAWGVVVSHPTASAFATQRAFHRGTLAAIGVFLAFGLMFWLALARQVLRPLEQLAAFSQRIGLEPGTPPEQNAELSALAERTDQMGHLIRSLTRMEEAIRARFEELSTLLRTSAAVVSTLDSRTVLDRILEQVEHLLGVEMCAIVALDERRGVFRVQASRGLSDHYVRQLAIDPEEPLSVTMRAIRRGEPVQVSDTETDETFRALRPRARAEGYRSVIAVPLNTQHAPPSALLVYRPEPHRYTQNEINLLTSFANHAAMAIENAALYARSDMRLKEQTRRLEALIQSLQDGLILEDLHGRVLYANRRISQMTGLEGDRIPGLPVSELIDRLLSSAQEEDAHEQVQAALQAGGERVAIVNLVLDGALRTFRLQVFQVTDPDGVPIGRGQIWHDITTDRELDRMKSSLISTVSHELRTPLAAIKGYVTTLLADDVSWDAQSQTEFLTIILNETERLSQLVNDLLDLSRIEAGTLRIARNPCHLDDLITQAVQQVHPDPTPRLHLEMDDDIPALYGDAQRLTVVLRNLIENAVKYAPPETPIYVRAFARDGEVVVQVEDQGPGIPPEHRRRIFESFYRVESGLSRTAAGAGLGLAICQGIVRAHGGDIWLEDRPRGTCIAFSIPLTTEEEPTP